MPGDTTIYWTGEGKIPSLIDSLPFHEKVEVISRIQELRDAPYSDPSGTYYFLLGFMVIFSMAAIYSNRQTKKSQAVLESNKAGNIVAPTVDLNPLVYTGNTLNFSHDVIAAVLLKRFPYYSRLDEGDKARFVARLKKFMALKTFIIHDESGYKEMPILISATAIQISFGLGKYLLPNFGTFNIYPAEFISISPYVRCLIGNVTGSTINLSWKHFLQGYQYPDDGQNVGIHELAHALYYQTFIVEKHVDASFREAFTGFDSYGNKVYASEKLPGNDLYSEYAMRDFQEFWAESMEIFFEKPIQMQIAYPELYLVMKDLLNQDPANSLSINIT